MNIYQGDDLMKVNVRKFLGENFAVEDAILLRELIQENIGEEIELDFEGFDRVPTTFLCCLFTDLINKNGRDFIISHINVKNLSNSTDYSRVVRGTTFN
jgi:hypothetical protein